MNWKNILIVIIILIVIYYLWQRNSSSENFSSSKPTLKLYYTNWCGWSQKFLPVWENMTQTVKNCNLIKIDCESQKSQCDGVAGFPSLVLEKGGKKIPYSGNRTEEDIVNFINSH
jgi:hypothetical protein